MAAATALLRAPIRVAAHALRCSHSCSIPPTTARCCPRVPGCSVSGFLGLSIRVSQHRPSQHPHYRRSPSEGGTAQPLWICAATSLRELYDRPVAYDDVEVKFVRSGGAGGQNVNKVNTKVDMRLKLSTATFLSEELKEGIRRKERNRVNSADELVIMSTRHRTQGANREDALARMQDLIQDVAESLVVKEMTAEQAKKQKAMKRRANQVRLQNKKAHSAKKAERRRKDW